MTEITLRYNHGEEIEDVNMQYTISINIVENKRRIVWS